ncbi:MAG: DNA polymerase III subunit delta [Rickettsiales bacterium]|nr:DNA polymerase III subunit delta [Rickettsiales bacterium]
MKIAPAQQESFFKNPGDCRAFLLYGPDEGQIRTQSRQLIAHFLGQKYDTLDLTEIPADSLSEDPTRLSDELSSYTLMGGDRLVVLRQASSDNAKVIEAAILSEPKPVWPLIVLAGELRPTSKLRKMFEAEKSLAALACYRDDARKVTQVLAESLRERNITCEQGVIPMLAGSLGNDRAITLQEIEKIDLYLGEERHLSAELARKLSGDNKDHTLDELFHAVCGGKDGLENTLTRCFNENIQPIGIYRMLSSHLQKLLSIKAMMGNGIAQKAAFTRHGVFFKQEPLISQQIMRWNDPALRSAISALLEAEREAKHGALPPEMTCRNLMHRLSRHAAGKSRRTA